MAHKFFPSATSLRLSLVISILALLLLLTAGSARVYELSGRVPFFSSPDHGAVLDTGKRVYLRSGVGGEGMGVRFPHSIRSICSFLMPWPARRPPCSTSKAASSSRARSTRRSSSPPRRPTTGIPPRRSTTHIGSPGPSTSTRGARVWLASTSRRPRETRLCGGCVRGRRGRSARWRRSGPARRAARASWMRRIRRPPRT
ncbi:hypothetical protein B0H11DRAFT_61724 [Mycena galericulata]|nr:hypothetical protein B0H11DRAFT_61724 [Mycena galericulata]